MALGECSVCLKEQAKYRCPKCPVVYCSLTCFKSPSHSHDSLADEPKAIPEPEVAKKTEEKPEKSNELFATIAKDPVIKHLLTYNSLQVHLAVILKLLNDSSITNEPLAENRKELANMRLCDLRMGGSEENELVEEFVSRVIELTS